MWDPLFDFLSVVLWGPVAKRPRFALLLRILVVLVTFGVIVLFVLRR